MAEEEYLQPGHVVICNGWEVLVEYGTGGMGEQCPTNGDRKDGEERGLQASLYNVNFDMRSETCICYSGI